MPMIELVSAGDAAKSSLRTRPVTEARAVRETASLGAPMLWLGGAALAGRVAGDRARWPGRGRRSRGQCCPAAAVVSTPPTPCTSPTVASRSWRSVAARTRSLSSGRPSNPDAGLPLTDRLHPAQEAMRPAQPAGAGRGAVAMLVGQELGSVEIRTGRPVLVRGSLRTSTPRRRSAGAARCRRLERTAGVFGQSSALGGA